MEGIAEWVADAEADADAGDDDGFADLDELELAGFCEDVEDEEAAAAEEVDVGLDDVPTAHWPFWHEYPFGQQFPLQVAKVPVRSVLKS